MGTFRRLWGSGGNQVSNVDLRGSKELPWPRRFQIGVTLDALYVIGCFRFFSFFLVFCQRTLLTQTLPNWCHTWCLTCKRVFQIFLVFFLVFCIKKTIMKNAHSKFLHQKLCNSPTIQMANIFCSLLKKNCALQFFSKLNQKNLATKNQNDHLNL